MSVLYNRIKSLCDSKGITPYRMCSDLNVSRNLMTELKTGRKRGISAETASKIANYFNVSVDYILGKIDQKKEPTSQEDELLKEFIDLFQKLSPEDQKREIAYLRERAASKDM